MHNENDSEFWIMLSINNFVRSNISVMRIKIVIIYNAEYQISQTVNKNHYIQWSVNTKSN